MYGQTELDELGAITRLSCQLWGDGRRPHPDAGGAWGGYVEFCQDPVAAARMGRWSIGYYLSPPHPRGFEPGRRRRPMFQGSSYTEIFDQVVLWKARRS